MEVDNKIGREISKETNSLAVFSDRRHVSTNLHPLFSLSLSLSLCLSLFPGGPAGLTPELKSALDDFVAKHRVVAFIKGTKDFPQCGFSNTVVQILSSAGVQFETVDVLADERLRSSLKEYSVRVSVVLVMKTPRFHPWPVSRRVLFFGGGELWNRGVI